MKFTLIALACLLAVAVAVAAPSGDAILRSDSSVDEKGFKFGYETSDGASHDAEGVLQPSHDPHSEHHESIAVKGHYTWKDKDGAVYTVNYVADENGFQPEGAHLPNTGIHDQQHQSHGKH